MKPQEVTHFHLFGGSGSGAAGFKDADPTIGTIKGKMVLLGGIDVDARACRDFYTLNGVTQACVDLFSLEQYLAWHGHMPPEGWREATADTVPANVGRAPMKLPGSIPRVLDRNGKVNASLAPRSYGSISIEGSAAGAASAAKRAAIVKGGL